MKLIALMSAGILIVLSGLNFNFQNHTDHSLYGTKWSLKKFYTADSVEEVNTKAFIKFDKEKSSAGGNGSCNTFGSSVTVEGQSISFKNIFSTKMYCEDVQQVENSYFKMLGRATRFNISGNTLKLYSDNSLLLEFEAIQSLAK